MSKIKIIKTKKDHEEAIKLIEKLMIMDPDPESDDGEKLSLLTTLVKDYESKVFPESLPDPIDAILFRMEQQNLKQADLIPFIGSRSKVSEVLSRKRPLTLSMIRALESGLGIPAKVLLKEPDELKNAVDIDWNRFPLKEMAKRGYFEDNLSNTINVNMIMEKFFAPVGSPNEFIGLLNKTNYRSTRSMNKYALVAWSTAVVKKALRMKDIGSFKDGIIDIEFMKKVAQFSVNDNGPIDARDFLKSVGIALIIEPHFPQTYLDGAAIMIDKERPIIGLTIKYDRLDNYWFNLMHELAHFSLHYKENTNLFYDDLDNQDVNKLEIEADQLASEALVPESKWEVSPARMIPSYLAARSLAKELGVHIAIVAGKMRREGDKYVYLNKIIKEGKVRKYFPNEKWVK